MKIVENMPLVFIIIVNYNGADDTIDCLKSLRNITYNRFKIIVVDNKSTDDSIIKLMNFSEVEFKLILAKENKGFSAGNNIGIEYAKKNNADFYLLLNNDTVVEPGFLEPLIRQFLENNNVSATIGKILYESDRKKIWYAGGNINLFTTRVVHNHFDEIDNIIDNSIQKVSFATGCCLCLSRDIVNDIGYLDEEFFLYEEDVDYCFKILKRKYNIYYVPESVIYHKVSSSTSKARGLSQYYIVRNKLLNIRKHVEFKYKFVAYSYVALMILNRIRKREFNLKYIMWAISDFKNNIKYKTIRNFEK